MSVLSSAAIEVLGQLFVLGPTWDGNLASKSGRDELVESGHAERWNGWQQLTKLGLELAVTSDVKNHYDKRWHRKQHSL